MVEEHRPDFAELLRHARRAVGLSQERLAEQAGLSTRAISALETGVNRSPRRDTLDLLADALDLSSEERRQWEDVRSHAALRAAPEAATGNHQALQPPRTNLPSQATRFFGRGDEIDRVKRLLCGDEARLVTLTGPGGSGKTRLALQVVGGLLAEYPDGVYFVDLAPLTDPGLALPAIATTLGLRPRSDQSISKMLVEWFAGKRLLLVLDNLEQILSVAPDISELLHRTSEMRILATSRAPLRLRAERELPVPPLSLPPINDVQGAATAVCHDAVRLFVDRARAVRPDFALDDEESLIVARICRQLDGLPLAIELAAASVRLFPPRAILTRLEHRLPLIDSGPRDAPARQQTVRDTIAWSFDLLRPDEQVLVRQLSVFKGGWTMDAAEVVGGGVTGSTALIDVIQASARLVEHNLVQVREWLDGSPRFSMFETIREFGIARLETDDELHAIHHRHADYFTQLFDGSERDWHTQRTDAWLQRGSVEIDNVRVALNWAIVHDPDTALRLAREFAWIWFMSGAYLEAEHWLDRALARSGDVPDDLRADAQWWIGAYATTRGAYLKARLALEEALAVHLDLNNETRAARCLHGLGRIAMYAGDLDEAVKLYESALELFGQHFDPSMTVTLINLGVALLSNGELERAAAAFDEAMGLAERDGLGWHRAQILDGRGRLAVAAGDLALARRNLKGSMELNRDAQDPRFVAQALESCAWLAIVEGSTAHAARLLGAVSRIRESIGVPVPPSIQFDYDRYFPVAQAQLSPADWLRAWAEGRALSQADAIEVALQGLL